MGDFVSWKAVNLPAVPRFSLGNVNDSQPMSIKVYSVKSDGGSGKGKNKHYEKDLETVLDIEASHRHVTKMGDGAKRWMKKKCEVGEIFTDEESSSLSSRSGHDELREDHGGQKGKSPFDGMGACFIH